MPGMQGWVGVLRVWQTPHHPTQPSPHVKWASDPRPHGRAGQTQDPEPRQSLVQQDPCLEVGAMTARWVVGGKDCWPQPWAGHGGGHGWATQAGRAGLAGLLGRAAGRHLLGLGQGQHFPSSRPIGLTPAAGRRHGRGLEVWRWFQTARHPHRPGGLRQTCLRPGRMAEGVTREVSCVCVCARVCVWCDQSLS